MQVTNAISVVACHYRLPQKRLHDFIDWNRELFVKYGVTLHLVSDTQWMALPSWVKCHVFPAPMKIYSPARASNYGIRQAGLGIVCKTDIDIVFSEDALKDVSRIGPGYGVYFYYLMAKNYETRHINRKWGSTCGTMALHFDDWNKLCGYDERLEGYGVEDGEGVVRAKAICKVDRSNADLFHIAHNGDELWSQTNVCLRRDLWNRRDGFCPDRHVINREIRDNHPKWKSIDWGKGIDLEPPSK